MNYKGYRIEKHDHIDNRLRRYDVYQLLDQETIFPTKQHLTRTRTLKAAKDWINEMISNVQPD